MERDADVLTQDALGSRFVVVAQLKDERLDPPVLGRQLELSVVDTGLEVGERPVPVPDLLRLHELETLLDVVPVEPREASAGPAHDEPHRNDPTRMPTTTAVNKIAKHRSNTSRGVNGGLLGTRPA